MYNNSQGKRVDLLCICKKISNSIDYVYKQHYVFNIKGNKFRLIVEIIFTKNLFIITLLALMQNMIKQLIALKFKDMTKIETKDQYDRAVQRVEELLPLITDKTPLDDPNSIELELLSNLVAEYSENILH